MADSFWDSALAYGSNFGSEATGIISNGLLGAIGREVDEEFDDEEPQILDDKVYITQSGTSPVNEAGTQPFSLAKITGGNMPLMIGGALVAAVILIKVLK